LGLVLLSPMLVSAAPGAAADPGATATAPAPRARHAPTRPSLDERVKQFAQGLGLSEDQQAAVKKILEKRQRDTLRLRLDPSLTGDVRIERFRALQVTTVKEIRAVLNEEQRKQYNPLAPRDIPQAPNQRSVEDWIKLTTPKE
jgi:Spy/CpxP family protein refolding chaperone